MKKNNIDLFSSDWILKNYLFVLFIGLLGTLYIHNSHKMEKKFREVRKLEIEVANLKSNYKSYLFRYSSFQKPTRILSIGKTIGLSTSGAAPKKIVIKKQ